ncbi:MAG TPA: glycosyltransferase family 1 protein [Burkholderiaceae bacterium]|nr:glycosyltransferase family 1 protein [Burkholderiaceae bacterium]
MFDKAWVAPLTLLPVPWGRQWVGRRSAGGGGKVAPRAERQLLIDVSVIVREDARTGIQRVVRALLMQLLEHPPAGWTIRLVRATKYRDYRLAPALNGLPEQCGAGAPLEVRPGDLFLGLDLAAHLVPRHFGQLARWKKQGVNFYFMVYDLLPLLQPQWFNPRTQRHFARWLHSVALLADGAICISRAVRDELEQELAGRYHLPKHSIALHHIHLGADLHTSAPSRGLPHAFDVWLDDLTQRPTVLMVGTLEPRKGHAQALGAFELLWGQGHDVNLVIAGKPGWKVDGLLASLRGHPELGKRLHWLEQPSDETLDALYRRTTGVLMASEAEGFGLPLVEAASYGKPVLARDTPVFREVGANAAHYFSGRQPRDLATALAEWLGLGARQPCKHGVIPWQTWADSARQLVSCLPVDIRERSQ